MKKPVRIDIKKALKDGLLFEKPSGKKISEQLKDPDVRELADALLNCVSIPSFDVSADVLDMIKRQAEALLKIQNSFLVHARGEIFSSYIQRFIDSIQWEEVEALDESKAKDVLEGLLKAHEEFKKKKLEKDEEGLVYSSFQLGVYAGLFSSLLGGGILDIFSDELVDHAAIIDEKNKVSINNNRQKKLRQKRDKWSLHVRQWLFDQKETLGKEFGTQSAIANRLVSGAEKKRAEVDKKGWRDRFVAKKFIEEEIGKINRNKPPYNKPPFSAE